MRYDLHTHTKYSLCSNLEPPILLKLAKKNGLSGISINDHHEIKGALKVKKINKDKDFEVIVGSEIDTPEGSILAYYINKKITSKTIPDIVEEIHDQGGLAVIAHPFRFSISKRHYFKYPLEKINNKIDAIEAINARNFSFSNTKAIKAADKYNICKIAGSDTHFFFELGKAYTEFEGDLKKAIKNNKTRIYGTTTVGPFGGLLSFIRHNILR